jgi:hypothetical protein
MKIRLFDILKQIEQLGHVAIASSTVEYYEKCCGSLDFTKRAGVLQMFEDVLEQELKTYDSINPADLILSPDFAFIKALARVCQGLELNCSLPIVYGREISVPKSPVPMLYPKFTDT